MLHSIKHILRMCGHALNSTVHERLDRVEERLENSTLPETQKALLEASIRHSEMLAEMRRQHVLQMEPDAAWTPSTGLMEFLYSYLPSRRVGVVPCATWNQASLERIGYQVLGSGDSGLDAMLTIGNPETLSECSAQTPRTQAPRVIAIAPGPVSSREMVRQLRAAGYPWHIVIYPIMGGSAFEANGTNAPSGTAFFFGDYALFSEALTWCAAVLPRTFVAPKPG